MPVQHILSDEVQRLLQQVCVCGGGGVCVWVYWGGGLVVEGESGGWGCKDVWKSGRVRGWGVGIRDGGVAGVRGERVDHGRTRLPHTGLPWHWGLCHVAAPKVYPRRQVATPAPHRHESLFAHIHSMAAP